MKTTKRNFEWRWLACSAAFSVGLGLVSCTEEPGDDGAATGGSGTGGNANASGGSASATGGSASGGVPGDGGGEGGEGGGAGEGNEPEPKFFGSAVGNAADYEDFLSYFDQLTPENAGKWGVVEATQGAPDWTALDAAHEFAEDHDLPFKFHTLVWGSQQPDWLAGLSEEEQLAAVDDWMAQVAERYPDLELIDVVNEPLHTKPAYRTALGGEGETGWDWLITSFEMAREHFPDAKLLINEYNELALDSFTTDYLVPIQLLEDRGLLDGIGVQAHFLEQAELDVVASNLDRLAATGLPIYVSELDVNFANDARQAERLSQLVTLFWEHPAVAGITHWGYVQGHNWQANSHLVHTDGTLRPAMTWLLCYLGGGTACELPVYTPPGWTGTAAGLTLETELYDEGHGLLAQGSGVAYTDAGDWLSFTDVDFDAGWDTFWVTYAKGAGTAGSISIHLDTLDSAAVLTVPLPSTGGWNTSATLEVAWPPLDGTHDVFVSFEGVQGVGNVDSVRFGVPQEPSDNLVTNGDFEAGTSGWGAGWGGGTLAASAAQAATGTQSLLASGFTSGAYAAYVLTSVLEPGKTYDVSAQALISGAATGRVTLSRKLACSGVADSYGWIENDAAVAPGSWTTLSGTLTIPADCTITEVFIYFENTTAGTDVYLDDVSVTEVVP